jgi:hypothetical protein
VAETSPAPTRRVVMIHTTRFNPDSFDKLCAELLPSVQVEHVVDESLLQDTIKLGSLGDSVRKRFAEHARSALATPPDAVVLTCSSIGEAADGMDVQRIDRAMAERAVALGSRIGVAATLPTTLDPTSALIRAAAQEAGKAVEVRGGLAEGAFALLGSGNSDEHDRLVREALQSLAEWADVIVLAQASMARATGGASSIESGSRQVPILTSPRLGVERLRETLGLAGD